MPIRILLADDHELMRESIAFMIASQSDMELVGQATSGAEALELARTLSPDVIVMDVRMPDLDGVEATRQLTASGSTARVVGVSAEVNDALRERLARSGASSLVSKDALFEQLLPGIRAAAARQEPSPPKPGATRPRARRGRR